MKITFSITIDDDNEIDRLLTCEDKDFVIRKTAIAVEAIDKYLADRNADHTIEDFVVYSNDIKIEF